MWAVEKSAPDQWDVIGAAVCLVGAGIILYAPRGA
jgi:small multidrug resistance family-3 protein